MPKISVHTTFQFVHADSAIERFAVGVHDVAEHIASHWYVAAHADVIEGDDSASDEAPAPKRRGRPAKSPSGQEVAAPATDADADEQAPAPAPVVDQIAEAMAVAAAQAAPADGAQ
jgi:hypothetical protein